MKIRWNCQITVEKPSTGRDPVYNTPTPGWEPLATLPDSPALPERFWAEKQDAMPSRSEAVVQGLNVARALTRIRLRWRDDIDQTMRVIVHRDAGADHVFKIVGGPAEIGGRKAYIELLCERFSTDGSNG